MIVIAKWYFEPDTSLIEENKEGFAEEFAKSELDFLIKHNELDVEDFTYEVINDGDDHEIPE